MRPLFFLTTSSVVIFLEDFLLTLEVLTTFSALASGLDSDNDLPFLFSTFSPSSESVQMNRLEHIESETKEFYLHILSGDISGIVYCVNQLAHAMNTDSKEFLCLKILYKN